MINKKRNPNKQSFEFCDLYKKNIIKTFQI